MRLHSAFGQYIDAPVVELPCSTKLEDGRWSDVYNMVCAVAETLSEDALVTPRDYTAIVQSLNIQSLIPDVKVVRGTNIIATNNIEQLNVNADCSNISLHLSHLLLIEVTVAQ